MFKQETIPVDVRSEPSLGFVERPLAGCQPGTGWSALSFSMGETNSHHGHPINECFLFSFCELEEKTDINLMSPHYTWSWSQDVANFV